MRKYAIKLLRTGAYLGKDGHAVNRLKDARMYADQSEAEDKRATCNYLWRRQGIIVPVDAVEVPPTVREFEYTELTD